MSNIYSSTVIKVMQIKMKTMSLLLSCLKMFAYAWKPRDHKIKLSKLSCHYYKILALRLPIFCLLHWQKKSRNTIILSTGQVVGQHELIYTQQMRINIDTITLKNNWTLFWKFEDTYTVTPRNSIIKICQCTLAEISLYNLFCYITSLFSFIWSTRAFSLPLFMLFLFPFLLLFSPHPFCAQLLVYIKNN